jgi:hypothetical protein
MEQRYEIPPWENTLKANQAWKNEKIKGDSTPEGPTPTDVESVSPGNTGEA